MDKINKIKNILPLLSEKQIDILDSIISSWDIKSSQLHTDDEIVKVHVKKLFKRRIIRRIWCSIL